MTLIELNNKDNFSELFQYSNQDSNVSKIYVDVGAFTGDTVEKALQINPNLKILAIEPIKNLCELMKQKFQSNKNITIVNKAAYNKKDSIQFNEYNGCYNGLSTLQKTMTELRPEGTFTNQILKYNIEADLLDNILSEHNIQTVDYLKIDTEGSEEQVLQDFTKYHTGTRFHIESHIINLENILLKLLELGSNIEKVTLFRDANIPNHVVGTIIGTFGNPIKPKTEIEKKIEKFTFPDGPRRVEFLIENAIKSKDKILNIGCADCFGFKDLNLDVTNVDLKDEVPPEYKSRSKFQIADAHNLQFSDKQFNCAILGDILEHVKDPVQVLKEAKRVANNVYITVPNEYEWHKDLKPFENPSHVRFYTYETLKEDLDKGLGKGYNIAQYNGGGWSFWCISYEEKINIEIPRIENPKQYQTANCCTKQQTAVQLIITTGPIIPEDNLKKDNKISPVIQNIQNGKNCVLIKPLRIGLISTPFFTVPPTGYSGLELVVWDLACGLDDLGHEVTIFGPKGSQAPPHGHLVVTGPSYDTVNIDWFQAEKSAYEVYRQYITSDKFDIIEGHDWFGFEYLIKLSDPKLKVTHQHHGGFSWASSPPVPKANLVALSNFMKTYSVEYFKQKGFNIDCRYNYNGTDLDFYKYDPSIKRTNRLLYVGRFSTFKGSHYAIELAKKVNLPIDLIGAAKFIDDPNYLKKIESMCDNDKIVIYKDVTNEFKLRKMQESKCLIFPSRMNEPFGLGIVQAMATGSPVIAFDDGAIKEIIINGETGFICNNIDDMVNAINKIDTIKPENCRKRAEFFSKENMARNKEKLYRDIISGNEW